MTPELAAAEWTVAGLVAAIVVLGLLLVFSWLTREKRHRRIRVGFFLERERFDDDDEPR